MVTYTCLLAFKAIDIHVCFSRLKPTYLCIHIVAGNTKLVTLSDAVKLAVDGNLQIPGSIILTLKKYYKVERERERD